MAEWQTRQTQNLLSEMTWRFKSSRPHQQNQCLNCGLSVAILALICRPRLRNPRADGGSAAGNADLRRGAGGCCRRFSRGCRSRRPRADLRKMRDLPQQRTRQKQGRAKSVRGRRPQDGEPRRLRLLGRDAKIRLGVEPRKAGPLSRRSACGGVGNQDGVPRQGRRRARRSDRLSGDAEMAALCDRDCEGGAMAGSWSVLPMLLSITGERGSSRSQRRFAT